MSEKDILTGRSFTVLPNGILLRDLRSRESKTQREVEDSCSIPPLRLSMYENGKPISIDHLKALSEYFQVSVLSLTLPDSAISAKKLGQELLSLFG